MNIGYVINEDSLSGVHLDKLFKEGKNISPKKSQVLGQCFEALKPGDNFYVETIDLIGQDFRTVKQVIDTLIEKGVAVYFDKEKVEYKPADQRAIHHLGQLAEFEKRSALKQVGGEVWRSKISIAEIDIAIKNITKGQRKTDIAKSLDISRPTLDRLIKKRQTQLQYLPEQPV